MRKQCLVGILFVVFVSLSSCRATFKESETQHQQEWPASPTDLWVRSSEILSQTWDFLEKQPPSKETLQQALDMEYAAYLPLENQSFSDNRFNGLVAPHLRVLEEGKEVLQSYNQLIFTEKWQDFQEKRADFYRQLDARGALYVADSYQRRLDYLLANPAQDKEIEATERALEEYMHSVVIEKTDETYGNGYPIYRGQAINHLGLPIPFLSGKVLLKDHEGRVVDERLFNLEDWQTESLAEITFITPKTFEEAEVVIDYFEAQWPWSLSTTD